MNRLFAIAIFFVGFQAHAGLFIDPYVSYAFSGSVEGDFVQTGPLPGTTDEDVKSGLLYGARLGWNFDGFMVGAVYQGGEITTEDSGGTETKSDIADMGLHLGSRLGKAWRGYVEYFFSATTTSEGETEAYTGSGYKVGFGYYLANHVTLNLEYNASVLDDTDMAGIESIDLDSSSVMASISFPFSAK